MANNGVASRPSRRSVDETVAALVSALHAKGITVFAVIDHSGEAARVGLKMRPTKLVIFGNPKAGTPVMVAVPSSALDLPLKVLVAEHERGAVSISYNRADYLAERHGVPRELVGALAVVDGLAALAAGDLPAT